MPRRLACFRSPPMSRTEFCRLTVWLESFRNKKSDESNLTRTRPLTHLALLPAALLVLLYLQTEMLKSCGASSIQTGEYELIK